MSSIHPAILKELRAAKEESGLSFSEIADELGWHKSRVSNYLLGLRRPGVAELAAVADVLELDVGELVKLVNE